MREYRRSAATRTSPTRRAAACCCDPPRPGRQPQRRPAAVRARREAVAGDRRRGGGNADAQDPGSLLGKLIRLDPAAPAPEVVARGLRNPWRFSFDRATGQLVLADVGNDAFEEINVGVAGNYGWPCFEGAARRTATPRLRQRDGGAGPDQGPHERRVLLDHRRLRRARPRPADAARPLPLRGLLRRRSCARSTSPRPRGDAATGLRRVEAELVRRGRVRAAAGGVARTGRSTGSRRRAFGVRAHARLGRHAATPPTRAPARCPRA